MTAITGTGRAARPLLGPRHAGHSLPAVALAAQTLPFGDDGVVAGTGPDGRPLSIRLYRPVPYDVLLIGGLWTAQVLALRAAGTGARVAVETGRPRAWAPLARAAGAGVECVTLHEVGRVPRTEASVDSPVLVVRDCGMRPPRGRVTASPWRAVLTLLPYVSPVAPGLMRDAALVGVERVSPEEVSRIGQALGLPQDCAEALPTLPDGVTLWCAEHEWQRVTTGATEVEDGLLGTPRRVDRADPGQR